MIPCAARPSVSFGDLIARVLVFRPAEPKLLERLSVRSLIGWVLPRSWRNLYKWSLSRDDKETLIKPLVLQPSAARKPSQYAFASVSMESKKEWSQSWRRYAWRRSSVQDRVLTFLAMPWRSSALATVLWETPNDAPISLHVSPSA